MTCAKLPRHKFSSVCEDLGLSSLAKQGSRKTNATDGNDNQEPIKQITPMGDEFLPIGMDSARGIPVFFLDAKGRGGTTALALATIQNDPETVRQLLQEVCAVCAFGNVMRETRRRRPSLSTIAPETCDKAMCEESHVPYLQLISTAEYPLS